MSTFSSNVPLDNRYAAIYLSPDVLRGEIESGQASASVKESNHYQVSGAGLSIDLYGNGFTYSGDTISGGTITSESIDQDGSRALTLSDISLTVAQVSSYGDDFVALSNFVFGGDDNILDSLTQSNSDVVVAGAGKDTIQSGPGNDLVLGNQGDDVILSNQDNDEVYGGMGNDVVFAGKGNDKVTGNEGDDVVAGNEGNDTLHGGQGNDIIYGGQDTDLIYGDLGNDVLYGNQGADTFRFAQGDGADVIADFSKADGDKIDLQGLSYNVAQNANGNAVLNVFGGGTIELAGIAAANVDATVFSG